MCLLKVIWLPVDMFPFQSFSCQKLYLRRSGASHPPLPVIPAEMREVVLQLRKTPAGQVRALSSAKFLRLFMTVVDWNDLHCWHCLHPDTLKMLIILLDSPISLLYVVFFTRIYFTIVDEMSYGMWWALRAACFENVWNWANQSCDITSVRNWSWVSFAPTPSQLPRL